MARTTFRSLTLGALALAGVVAAAPAGAQSVCPGRLSANAFAPVPRNAAIAVPDRTGTENERRLRDSVIAALRTAGRQVNADAPYILSWRGGISQEGGTQLGFGDTMQDRTFRDGDDISWAQNVPRAGGRQMPTLRVSGVVELRERSSNRVVWTAVLSCERHGTDDAALFAHLANAIAPWIGQPLAGRPF
jgi:hypothetical protein